MPEETEQPPSRLKAALGGALAGLAAQMDTASARDAAIDAVKCLTDVYMNTQNVKLARQCRVTVKVLMDEYGPENQQNKS